MLEDHKDHTTNEKAGNRIWQITGFCEDVLSTLKSSVVQTYLHTVKSDLQHPGKDCLADPREKHRTERWC